METRGKTCLVQDFFEHSCWWLQGRSEQSMNPIGRVGGVLKTMIGSFYYGTLNGPHSTASLVSPPTAQVYLTDTKLSFSRLCYQAIGVIILH